MADFPRRVMAAAGTMAGLLGITVLVGWHTHHLALLQVLPGNVAMQYNTALGFIACGGALLALAFARRRATAVGGALAALLGAGILLEYFAGIPLRLDQRFMTDYVTPQDLHPGRMAPNTALCFLLVGTALVLSGVRKRPTVAVSLLGSVAAALGVLALLGYALGLRTAYSWGQLTPMALHTAAGFLLLGLGVVASTRQGAEEETPRWLPLLVAVTFIPITLGLRQALVAYQHMRTGQETTATAKGVSSEIDEQMRSRLQALGQIAGQWRTAPASPGQQADAEAGLYFSTFRGTESITWRDASLRVVWQAARPGTRRGTQDSHLFLRAPARGAASLSPITREDLLLAYAPVSRGGQPGGWVVAVLGVPVLLDDILDAQIAPEYGISLTEGGREIYARQAPGGGAEPRSVCERVVALPGASWRLRVWPGPRMLAERPDARLAEVALLLGLVMSWLLALAASLAVSARRHARTALGANKELQGEIAERQRVQAEASRLAAIVESSTDAIIGKTLDGLITSWNRGAEVLYGYAAEEALGRPISLLIPPGHDDEVPALLERVRRGELVEQWESARRRKDGGVVEVSLTISPIKDAAGAIVGASTIARDIGERKRAAAALARQAEELQRSNAELQQFAYVASHDLQEPLRMVASYVQVLARQYRGKLDADADEFIGYAVDGAKRMQQLINDLLAYSRVGTHAAEFAPTDCERILGYVLNDLQMAIRDAGAVVTHDPLPVVTGDEVQLTQLLQNLVSNAIKFHGPEPPRVHLSVQETAQEWVFTVRDNGVGIAPEQFERIFLIFQRLHPRGKYPGTGIGLAICKRIVERHGGRIWVASEPAKGSAFTFALPKRDQGDHHE